MVFYVWVYLWFIGVCVYLWFIEVYVYLWLPPPLHTTDYWGRENNLDIFSFISKYISLQQLNKNSCKTNQQMRMVLINLQRFQKLAIWLDLLISIGFQYFPIRSGTNKIENTDLQSLVAHLSLP
jgi:hypothetical protein